MGGQRISGTSRIGQADVRRVVDAHVDSDVPVGIHDHKDGVVVAADGRVIQEEHAAVDHNLFLRTSARIALRSIGLCTAQGILAVSLAVGVPAAQSAAGGGQRCTNCTTTRHSHGAEVNHSIGINGGGRNTAVTHGILIVQLINRNRPLGSIGAIDAGGVVIAEAGGLNDAIHVQVVAHGQGGVVHIQHVAILIQNDRGVGAHGKLSSLGASGVGTLDALSVVVLGAADGHALSLRVGVHGAGDDLSLGDALHSGGAALVAHSVEDVVLVHELRQVLEVFLIQSSQSKVAGVGQSHGVQSAAVLAEVAVGLSQIGVDVNDAHVAVIVHVHLGQNAVSGHTVVSVINTGSGRAVAAEIVGLVRNTNIGAVGIDVQLSGAAQVVDVAAAQQRPQVALGDLGGVGGQRSLSIGADLVGLQGPLSGGTAEGVAGVVVHLQVAVIQVLAQLNNPAGRGDGGAVPTGQILDRLGIGLLAGDIHIVHLAGVHSGAVGSGHVNGVVIGLHHAGLQGVQNQLSQLVAGHGLPHAGVHILEQSDAVALGDGGQLPVVAEVALILEVAQSLHQHQGSLGGGDAVAAAVNGVAVTRSDLVGPAGGHIGLGPGGHVRKGRGAGISGHVVVHQVGHDNGHLVAGDVLVGIKVSAFIADHHAHRLQDFDGFLVMIRGDIVVARSAGASHHQANQHGGRQAQAENPFQVSHWNSSLL